MSQYRRGAGYSSAAYAGEPAGSLGAYPGANIPIPNLPGNRPYNPREWQRATQQRCQVRGGIAQVYDGERYERLEDQAAKANSPAPRPPPPQAQQEYKEPTLPAWVAFDRKVLRFSAYFKEAVSESPHENARVRKCIILFYLADGTLHIIEPKEDNSGIAQGDFLKRHRVPKSRTSRHFIDVEDLNVGREVSCYGRTFYIFACDNATRSFLGREGIQVPENEQPPEDQHHTMQREKANRASTTRQLGGKAFRQKDQDWRWLTLDKQVLRFYCSWDDRRSLYGDRLPFILHYFLADDTVEVVEVHVKNSGRDLTPLLLKRGPLPKYLYSVGARPMSANTRAKANFQYYHWKDMGVGKSVYVYGREMKLFDCDDFTRSWYKEKAGISMQKMESRFETKPQAKEPVVPPDTMGIGRDEDTRQNCLSLLPKPPKANWTQFQNCSGQVMRFYAWMVEDPANNIRFNHSSDRDRRFIISYFLVDDTAAVFEPPVRNSGIIGGKFLERCTLRKPGSRSVKYMARDFYEGAIINVNGRLFQLGEPDLFTVNYQAARKELYPLSDFNQIITRLSDEVHCQGLMETLKTTLIEVDRDGAGVVDKHDLVNVFRSLGIAMDHAEGTTIARKLDQNGKVVPIVDLLEELGVQDRGSSQAAARPGEQHYDEFRPSQYRSASQEGQAYEYGDGPVPDLHLEQEGGWMEHGSSQPSPGSFHGGGHPAAYIAEADFESIPVGPPGDHYLDHQRSSSRCGSGNRSNRSQGLW